MTSRLGAALAAMLLAASGIGAQQTGTVTGRVLDAQSGQPIASAQVYISGLDIGVLTPQNGRYILLNVPAGTHTLTAERIGFRRETREITVAAGGTVVQDYSLSQEALQLDEVIVTGTPGGTRRRALGNDVTRVDGSTVAASVAAPSFETVLSGRAPGVNVQQSTGQVGGGNQIRIRGLGSASLSNQPLLYVDGVRVDNGSGGSSFASRDGTPASRLNDFNPEDIESIEIIKGPAAATLYGTEASAGVIQIITKRGAAGTTTFDAQIQTGVNYFADPIGRMNWNYRRNGRNPNGTTAPMIDTSLPVGALIPWHVVQSDIDAGFGSPLQNGLIQDYQLSLTGGSDRLRYYVAGNYGDEEGYVSWNTQTRWGIRANLDATLSEKVDLSVSTNLLDSNTRFPGVPAPYGGIPGSEAWGHAARFQTRGWYTAPMDADSSFDNRALVDRATWSTRLTHNPFEWLTHRLVIGEDRVAEVADVTLEASPLGAADPFLGGLGTGQKSRTVRRSQNFSFDYSGTANWRINPSVNSVFSAGIQYFKTSKDEDTLLGRIFPVPGLTSLDAAATVQGGGSFVENASLGMYLQEQLEWRDRVFFTAAVRGDDNSAFGSDYDAAIYPKFSGAWVISEEEFFDLPLVSSMRFRGAWGKAGRQPDVFAAARLFDPVTGPGGASALRPGSVGNPDLGPEVGTEIEAGFDAGLLDDRVSMTFTYYNQKTTDALLNVPVSLASGFLGSQTVNLGQISNKGVEITMDARMIETDAFGWNLGFSYSHNKNRIDDLGGVPENTGATRLLMEGYPIGTYWAAEIVSAEWTGDPDPANGGRPANVICKQWDVRAQEYLADRPCTGSSNQDLVYHGPGEPVWTGAITNTVTLLGGDLRLFANIDFKGGHVRNSCGMGCGQTVFGSTYAVNGDPNNGISPDPAVWWSEYVATNAIYNSPGSFHDQHEAGFMRLRDVSASYNIPTVLADRMGASRASLTVAMRNLGFLWRAEEERYSRRIPDPEAGNFSSQATAAGGNIPYWPSTQLTATLRVSF